MDAGAVPAGEFSGHACVVAAELQRCGLRGCPNADIRNDRPAADRSHRPVHGKDDGFLRKRAGNYCQYNRYFGGRGGGTGVLSLFTAEIHGGYLSQSARGQDAVIWDQIYKRPVDLAGSLSALYGSDSGICRDSAGQGGRQWRNSRADTGGSQKYSGACGYISVDLPSAAAGHHAHGQHAEYFGGGFYPGLRRDRRLWADTGFYDHFFPHPLRRNERAGSGQLWFAAGGSFCAAGLLYRQ